MPRLLLTDPPDWGVAVVKYMISTLDPQIPWIERLSYCMSVRDWAHPELVEVLYDLALE